MRQTVICAIVGGALVLALLTAVIVNEHCRLADRAGLQACVTAELIR